MSGIKRKRTASTLAATIEEMDCRFGFDCVIVCTSNLAQENYWQERLESTRGQAAKEDALIVVVHEDWSTDGAGNGLGTLYAYIKARIKASVMGHDLDRMLISGKSIGIYHTAGKGTRLAPLPGAENNNKPGVKLPSLVETSSGQLSQLTILEAVIRQTGCFAPRRLGRCSVFWGDQIFIPTVGHLESGTHHADILAKMGPLPNKEEWMLQGLEKYGLIAVNEHNEATQVEKVSYDTARRLLSSFGTVTSVGPSLGSFSLSNHMLFALLAEFNTELSEKSAKMDSDPHFWMPMTLSKESYVTVMKSKGETEHKASVHHDRISVFKARLLEAHPDQGCFGAIDVGQNCYWWDFGQLKLYRKNTQLAMADSDEAKALRNFLRIPETRVVKSNLGSPVILTGGSTCLASSMKSGNLDATIACNISTVSCEASNSVLMNVTAKSIKANNCVLYNVVDESEDGLVLPDGHVMTNVFLPGKEKLIQTSSVETDGGKLFKVKLTTNPYSFDDVYNMNQSVDVAEAYAAASVAHETLREKLVKL